MAAIKDTLVDVLAKLSTLSVTNEDGNTSNLFVRIWNNQVQYEEEGKLESYPKPAAFLEVVTGAAYEILGEGYRKVDLALRVHLVHIFYNNEGTFEQDLAIFDLRDSLLKLFHLYKPVGCSSFIAIAEEQDFSHTNVYHYIITFICSLVDDAAAKEYDETTPPSELDLSVTFN